MDTARGSWLAGSHPEVTRKSRWSERLVGAPREHAHEPFFALAPCSTMSLKRS